MRRRRFVLVGSVVLGVVIAALASGDSFAESAALAGAATSRPVLAASDNTERLQAALTTLDDMPEGWQAYEPLPDDTFRLRVGVCGEKLRSSPAAMFRGSVAFALDDQTGPVFGERISLYSSKVAKQVVARTRERDYPCRWSDAGIRWSAAIISHPRLGDETFAYQQRRATGSFPYSYEYVVRRGGVILAFVVSADHPNRALAESLVRSAVRRFDAE
jgi:hypothetical protein